MSDKSNCIFKIYVYEVATNTEKSIFQTIENVCVPVTKLFAMLRTLNVYKCHCISRKPSK